MTLWKNSKAIAVACLTSVLAGVPGNARATPPAGSTPNRGGSEVPQERRNAARRHFQNGVALADRQRFAEALVEFRLAYETVPHFAILRNIGLTHAMLGQPTKAVEHLRRYLDEGGSAIGPENRAQMDQEIARQEERIARVTIRTNPPGAAVRVDGREVGRTPLVRPVGLDPGDHRLTALLDGYGVVTRTITVEGDRPVGPEQEVELELRRSPPPAQTLPVDPTGSEESSDRRGLGPMGVAGATMAGAGVLGLGIGLTLWVCAKNRDGEAHRAFDSGAYDDAFQTRKSAEDLVKGTVIADLAGSSLLAVGSTMFALAWLRKESAARPQISPVWLAPGVSGRSAELVFSAVW